MFTRNVEVAKLSSGIFPLVRFNLATDPISDCVTNFRCVKSLTINFRSIHIINYLISIESYK